MRSYTILIDLLVIELGILFLLISAIIFHRTSKFFEEIIEKKRNSIISNYIIQLMGKNKPFDMNTYPGRKSWRKTALVVLESFDRRFKEGDWVTIRNSACEALLLPKARKWTKSIFWLKRNYAARTFALHSLPEDEERILKLIDDRKFLIRSPAAYAAVQLESRKGIEKILQAISNEPGYPKFYYRDVLLLGSINVQKILVDLAANPFIHKAVLDVLGAKSWGGNIPFLKDDLISSDPQIRFLALRVLTRNLLPDSLPFFQTAAKDGDSKVREAALQGLSLFPPKDSSKLLEAGLSDPVWEVRVQAGKGLKQQGEKGVEILERQPKGIASEAANYAKQFG